MWHCLFHILSGIMFFGAIRYERLVLHRRLIDPELSQTKRSSIVFVGIHTDVLKVPWRGVLILGSGVLDVLALVYHIPS